MSNIFSFLSSILRSPSPTQPPLLTPSYADVCIVRAMLRNLNLPTELILEILEYAEYWPSRTVRMQHPCEATAGVFTVMGKVAFEFDVLPEEVLKAFGEEKVKVKAVEWRIRSRDQGWTSEGTEGESDCPFSGLKVYICSILKGNEKKVFRRFDGL